MLLKEFFTKLGLDVDAQSFAAGQLAVEGVKLGLGALVSAAQRMGRSLTEVVTGVANTASVVSDTSQSIGVSSDALQELTHAANLSGSSLDGIRATLTVLSRNMAAAKAGNKEVAETFSDIGVSVKNADGSLRDADQVLGDVADVIASMPDGAEKTALAMRLVGKSGASMIPLLNKGSAGIGALRQEAHDLGLVLDGQTIQSATDFNDTLQRTQGAMQGIKNAVASALMPSLLGLAESVLAWVKENRELLRQRLDKVFAVLGKVVRVLWFVFTKLSAVLSLVVKYLDELVVIIGGALLAQMYLYTSAAIAAKLATMSFGTAAIWAGLKAAAAWALAALPVLALAALFVLIILVVNDLWVALNGGESLIQKLWDKWSGFIQEWTKPKDGDPWWMLLLKAAVDAVLNFGETWDYVVDAWAEKFGQFFGWVERKIGWIKEAIWDIGDFLGITDNPERDAVNAEVQSAMRGNGIMPDFARLEALSKRGASATPTAPAMRPSTANSFKADIVVNVPPGTNGDETAGFVRRSIEEFYNTRMREAED